MKLTSRLAALAASIAARAGFRGISRALDPSAPWVRPSELEARRYLGDEAYDRGVGRSIARAAAKRERRAERYRRELRAWVSP